MKYESQINSLFNKIDDDYLIDLICEFSRIKSVWDPKNGFSELEAALWIEQKFKEFGLTNIKVVVGPFEDTLNQVCDSQHYDFIYFDGNHSKDATLDYFTQCLFMLTEKSIWLFDDIHWSREMEKSWEYIMAHRMVSCTLDILGWGLVFFEPKYIKENQDKYKVWLDL